MSASFILDHTRINFLVNCDTKGAITYTNSYFKELTSHIGPIRFSDILPFREDREAYEGSVELAMRKSPFPDNFVSRTNMKNGAVRWIVWEVYHFLDSISFHGQEILDIETGKQYKLNRMASVVEQIHWVLNHELWQPYLSAKTLRKYAYDPALTEEERASYLEKIAGQEAKVSAAFEKVNKIIESEK